MMLIFIYYSRSGIVDLVAMLINTRTCVGADHDDILNDILYLRYKAVKELIADNWTRNMRLKFNKELFRAGFHHAFMDVTDI